jgi:serine phosphatase RsbU (regulator of sigma subunit)
MAAPLRVVVGTEVTEIFKSAAGRTDREFYDDALLVDEAGRYAGMIPMRSLVRLQTEHLVGNIASLEASRQEIAARNRQMEEDLRMAREVQLAMLPQAHAPLSAAGLTLRLAHRYQPAGGVSGDFFDVLRLSDRALGILICDVMGHGVRSALITAMVRAMLEELRPIAADPGIFLTRLNRDLTAILRQTGAMIFVTAAYVVIDPGGGQLRYAQAGHPTPLRWDARVGRMRPLSISPEAAGPALGLIDDFIFSTVEEKVGADDRVVLFTDGLSEAPNAGGEEFGQERLADVLAREMKHSLDAALTELLAEVSGFCGSAGFPDDVCVVAAGLERA